MGGSGVGGEGMRPDGLLVHLLYYSVASISQVSMLTYRITIISFTYITT